MIAQTESKTKIAYNRQSKTWQAINGRVHNFVTRQEALICALQHDHPELGARVETIARSHGFDKPLMDRLLNAAVLVAKGHVAGETVTSQTTGQTYQVTFNGTPTAWSCDCQDFAHGGIDTHYGQMCKHSLAALLKYLLG